MFFAGAPTIENKIELKIQNTKVASTKVAFDTVRKFMWVPFLRPFPGNEAHQLSSGAPKVGVVGGVQKVYVVKVYVLFSPLKIM